MRKVYVTSFLVALLALSPIASANAKEHYVPKNANGGPCVGLLAAGLAGAALALAQTTHPARAEPPAPPVYIVQHPTIVYHNHQPRHANRYVAKYRDFRPQREHMYYYAYAR